MTLSGGAAKRVPRDVLRLKSPNLWKVGTWRNRETAGDITRTGGGGVPDGGSLLSSSARWLLFFYHKREEGTARPSAPLVSCLIKSPLPFGSAEFLNHPRRLTVPRRVGTQRARVGAAGPHLGWMSPP